MDGRRMTGAETIEGKSATAVAGRARRASSLPPPPLGADDGAQNAAERRRRDALTGAMDRHADGDAAAFAEVYDLLAPRLLAYLTRRLDGLSLVLEIDVPCW